MQQLKVVSRNGMIVVDSRQVAAAIDKPAFWQSCKLGVDI